MCPFSQTSELFVINFDHSTYENGPTILDKPSETENAKYMFLAFTA